AAVESSAGIGIEASATVPLPPGTGAPTALQPVAPPHVVAHASNRAAPDQPTGGPAASGNLAPGGGGGATRGGDTASDSPAGGDLSGKPPTAAPVAHGDAPGDDDAYTVVGTVLSAARAGVGGLRVQVVDKNVGQDVPLAETLSDARGSYQVV